MPVYEYRCLQCGNKFAKLIGMTADSGLQAACPKCSSADVTKLISRFQRSRSEDERLDSFEEAALMAGDDPKATSRLLKEMGREIGDDGEEDFDEYIEDAQRGLHNGVEADESFDV